MKRRLARYYKTSRNRPLGSKLKNLLAAALAIPSIALSVNSVAQETPSETSFRLQYGSYRDYQNSAKRIHTQGPQASITTPLTESTHLNASFFYETVSGASPIYLSTLSGASGVGIEDRRRGGNIDLVQNFEQFSLGFGTAISSEDDYKSRSFAIKSKYWTEDKNTIWALDFGLGKDNITASNNPDLYEDRRNWSLLTGVTQVLNSKSVLQLNFSWNAGEGYFSDPYKLFDQRPHSRDQYALLARHILFLSNTDGSWHNDYRIYFDSWGLNSQTFETSLYHPISANFSVQPSLRYYTQDRADFFSQDFPPKRTAAYVSADQRLGQFGEISAGLTLTYQVSQTLSLDLHLEHFHQRPGLALGGGDSALLQPFSGQFVIFGFSKKLDRFFSMSTCRN